ncbi:methyltransferase domain-containing protein [Streptosporangiaceae bacterium NEAU-GS5]|nr:methyltransferase domain-containing protein [Streptosporangiaceae bacterium NEAU-GS5]
MRLGRLLHHHADHEHHEEHAEGGGTIDYPRAYEVMVSLWFLGRRRRVYLRLATLAGIKPGDRVLDVGCGTGYMTRVMAPVVGSSGRLTGVDASASMIEYAARRAPAGCSYIVGKAQALDLPDAVFDVVVSTVAVHHIPVADRAAAVREMFRVLRPGGRLLIAEFRPPTGKLAAHVMGALTGPAMRNSPRDLLGTMIPDAGFEVVDEGDQPPFFYYVRAVRPADAVPRRGTPGGRTRSSE